jgi:transposase
MVQASFKNERRQNPKGGFEHKTKRKTSNRKTENKMENNKLGKMPHRKKEGHVQLSRGIMVLERLGCRATHKAEVSEGKKKEIILSVLTLSFVLISFRTRLDVVLIFRVITTAVPPLFAHTQTIISCVYTFAVC